jgi:putative Holliday junction resolvase
MPDAGGTEGVLLAFDFGLKRIGVAVGQTHTRTASALETVPVGGQGGWPRIQELVRQWRPSALVVGLPLDPDGAETEMCRQARTFGEGLAQRTGLPVYFQDERLTSQAVETGFAEARAAGARRRRDARMKDAMAARIILENWLQSHPDDRR